MPQLSGVFENFKYLEEVPPEDINQWLKKKVEPHIIKNILADRIIYPQTIPITLEEMEIDLAILREAIKRDSKRFLGNSSKEHKGEIIIPKEFLSRFSSIHKLVEAFIDVLNLNLVTEVLVKEESKIKVIGSIIIPEINFSQKHFDISVNDEKFVLKINTLTDIPIENPRLKVSFNKETLEVKGGILGLLVDLRKKT